MNPAQITIGDTVRVSSGLHKGKFGEVMRVVPANEEKALPTMALIKFRDGKADYCYLGVLKRTAKQKDTPEKV